MVAGIPKTVKRFVLDERSLALAFRQIILAPSAETTHISAPCSMRASARGAG